MWRQTWNIYVGSFTWGKYMSSKFVVTIGLFDYFGGGDRHCTIFGIFPPIPGSCVRVCFSVNDCVLRCMGWLVIVLTVSVPPRADTLRTIWEGCDDGNTPRLWLPTFVWIVGNPFFGWISVVFLVLGWETTRAEDGRKPARRYGPVLVLAQGPRCESTHWRPRANSIK